jgi:hypothetical protein
MKIKLLILFVTSAISLFPQVNEYEADPFRIVFSDNTLSVGISEDTLYTRNFTNAAEYFVDLDGDSLNEFLIIDQPNESKYMVYIYNTLDTFFLADSINSGGFEPYFTLSEEIEGIVIVAGNTAFSRYIKGDVYYLPINCFKFESGELFLINDELYDFFVSENEDLIEFIENYFDGNIKNCTTSMNILPALASAYANYINSGEPTLAHQLINKYYFCEDKEKIIREMDDLILNN